MWSTLFLFCRFFSSDKSWLFYAFGLTGTKGPNPVAKLRPSHTSMLSAVVLVLASGPEGKEPCASFSSVPGCSPPDTLLASLCSGLPKLPAQTKHRAPELLPGCLSCSLLLLFISVAAVAKVWSMLWQQELENRRNITGLSLEQCGVPFWPSSCLLPKLPAHIRVELY